MWCTRRLCPIVQDTAIPTHVPKRISINEFLISRQLSHGMESRISVAKNALHH
jgi:hypothetical protein